MAVERNIYSDGRRTRRLQWPFAHFWVAQMFLCMQLKLATEFIIPMNNEAKEKIQVFFNKKNVFLTTIVQKNWFLMFIF